MHDASTFRNREISLFWSPLQQTAFGDSACDQLRDRTVQAFDTSIEPAPKSAQAVRRESAYTAGQVLSKDGLLFQLLPKVPSRKH